MKAKYIIGLIIIGGFAGWSISSFMSTTIRYVSLADLPSAQGTVQVMGKIDFAAMRYDAEKSQLVFDILDLEDPGSRRRVTVVYTGIVPGNFEQATSVVAKGRYEQGVFHADQLLVKCPSKYQGLEEKETQS